METTLPEYIGPYRIIQKLGEGGMGAVFQAIQTPIDRTVALKTLHLSHAGNKLMVARFLNEAKTLGKLQHPNVVQVIDYGTTSAGVAYLVMEFLRGETLSKRLKVRSQRRSAFPLLSILQLGFQVADALACAHANGIIHRDLKPDNLMLVRDAIAPGGERVKILDFGIAKLTDKDSPNVKTATQAIMGTPMYMSPEQCQGAGKVDAKTDVYSLGCVLYESLCGFPPFLGEGHGEIIAKHLFQEPASITSHVSDVPAPVVALVHRMLAKDKSVRPSMSEAADELGAIISSLSNVSPLFRTPTHSTMERDATQHRIAQPNTFGNARGQLGVLAAAIQRKRIHLGVFLIGSVLLIFSVRWNASRKPFEQQILHQKANQSQTHQLGQDPAQTVRAAQTDKNPSDQSGVPSVRSALAQHLEQVTENESRQNTGSKPKKGQVGDEPVQSSNKPNLEPKDQPGNPVKATSSPGVYTKKQQAPNSTANPQSFSVVIEGASGEPAKVLKDCATIELKNVHGLPNSYQINMERAGSLHVVAAPPQVYHTGFQKCIRNGLKTLSVSVVPQSAALSIRSGR